MRRINLCHNRKANHQVDWPADHYLCMYWSLIFQSPRQPLIFWGLILFGQGSPVVSPSKNFRSNLFVFTVTWRPVAWLVIKQYKCPDLWTTWTCWTITSHYGCNHTLTSCCIHILTFSHSASVLGIRYDDGMISLSIMRLRYFPKNKLRLCHGLVCLLSSLLVISYFLLFIIGIRKLMEKKLHHLTSKFLTEIQWILL